ncbi:MAG: CbiX/SirB N-terminal domain-containing protein [Candidatus Hinthialibacter antarcticus]|nr:CbiX/SirB N-terminal domain-containing protein [Candidatus Hinthialibacter antarcticus]
MTKPHLLIVAHGSRSSAWNNAVVEFAQQADAACQDSGAFSGASACFMEHGQPSIADAVQSLSQSNSKVIAQPLFLSVSQHVTVDIPNEFEKAAAPIEAKNNHARFQCGDCTLTLLPPPQAPELLADNAARRIRSKIELTPQDGVIFVYYGTKSYLAAWDALAQSVIDNMKGAFPGVNMRWVYAGDMVAFSPEPLSKAIDDAARQWQRVVILPALVAKGVIQNEVIPAAIANAHASSKAVYFHDAILPDPILATRFVETAAARF